MAPKKGLAGKKSGALPRGKGGEKGGLQIKGAASASNGWRMIQNDRWVPFEPGVSFRGTAGEDQSFWHDGEQFEVTFATSTSAVCVNIRTNASICLLHAIEVEELARKGAFDPETGEASPERSAEAKMRLIINRHLLSDYAAAVMKSEVKESWISQIHGVAPEMVMDLRIVLEHDTWEGTKCGKEWIHEWLTYGAEWLEELQDTEAKARHNSLWCLVCSRNLHCEWSFEEHKKGKDHHKKVKGWNWRYGKPAPTPGESGLPYRESMQPGEGWACPSWPRLAAMTRRDADDDSDFDAGGPDPWEKGADDVAERPAEHAEQSWWTTSNWRVKQWY